MHFTGFVKSFRMIIFVRYMACVGVYPCEVKRVDFGPSERL